MKDRKKIIFVLSSLILGLGIIGVLLTLSRFNIAILIFQLFGFVVLIIARFKEFFAALMRPFVLVSLFFCLISMTVVGGLNFGHIASYMGGVSERIAGTVLDNNPKNRASSSFRMEMNVGAIEIIKEEFPLGIGFNNSRYIWDRTQVEVPPWWRYQPHNIFIVIALEGGILSLVLYLIIWFIPIRRLFMLRKVNPSSVVFMFPIISILLFPGISNTNIGGIGSTVFLDSRWSHGILRPGRQAHYKKKYL